MGEETKFVISELNKLLNKNYNLSSFESLSKEQLLQILCDTLMNLEAMPSIDVQKSPEQAIIIVLEILQNIKYSPAKDVTPEEFREGIALGNRTIIRPILYWLLSNPQQVKKRAYLAKYVEKVECPVEMLDDADIRIMHTQYENLIDEFWKAYSENRKEKRNAMEAKELQQDIAKMEDDTSRLLQRIEQQKEKIDNIPNKEVLLTIVRTYRNEMNEQKKLEEQLIEQKNLEVQMETEIKDLKNKLAYKKARHPANLEPMRQVMNELRTNKILETQLPEELKIAKKEFDLYESVIKGSEITMQDLNELNNEFTKVNAEIQALIERKMASNSNTDSELGPFRNQAAIIANKKQEISNTVMELKNKMNAIDAEISEKEEVLMTLVGGPLLQGDNLKKYVAKLRENNIVYKEYKSQLRALTTEQGILTRTLDVLKLMDPSTEEMLKKKLENSTDAQEQLPSDSDELKNKVKKMATETDQVRAETAQIREELRAYTAEIQPIMNEYNRLKENFESITEPATDKLKQIDDDISTLEDQIKAQEDKWKIVKIENERKEELLHRLNEDLANAADPLNKQPTQIDILKQKLTQQEKSKKNLEEELKYLERQKVLRSIINRKNEIQFLFCYRLKHKKIWKYWRE